MTKKKSRSSAAVPLCWECLCWVHSLLKGRSPQPPYQQCRGCHSQAEFQQYRVAHLYLVVKASPVVQWEVDTAFLAVPHHLPPGLLPWLEPMVRIPRLMSVRRHCPTSIYTHRPPTRCI